MTQRAITASMLYNLVVCPHRVERDLFDDESEKDPSSAFVQMLWERGRAHESALMESLRAGTLDLRGQPVAQRFRRTLEAMRNAVPLIRGARLEADGLVGEPDLLRREDGGYVAGDIKSGRGLEDAGAGQPGKFKLDYAVQVALYTDLLERLGFSAGRAPFIWDVDGNEVTYDLRVSQGAMKSESWWEAYQACLNQARRIVARTEATRPALESHCKSCCWHSSCVLRAEATGDLSLIPEVGRNRRDHLMQHFADIREFAAADLSRIEDADPKAFKGIGSKVVRRLQARARLQLDPAARPYALGPLELPKADTILFYDVETDPLMDFCYLHGFHVVEGGSGRFVAFNTTDDTRAEERRAFAECVAFVRSQPGAPVVHYSAYEKTTWKQLAARYPDVVSVGEVDEVFQKPRGFDLYSGAIRPRTEWPTRDYSIKSIARWLGFTWRDSNPSGAASIEWFQGWLKSRDPADLQRILDYNEDDCRAMHVVLEALRTLPVREAGE